MLITFRLMVKTLTEKTESEEKKTVEDTQIGMLKSTRDRMKNIGKMSQNYDETLNMIMDFWEVNHPSWDNNLIDTDMEFLGPRAIQHIIDQLKNRELNILDIDGKMVLIRMKDFSKKLQKEDEMYLDDEGKIRLANK